MAKEKKKPENIVLKNIEGITIDHADADNFFVPIDNEIEFFMDEHGFQWVKLVPQNGEMEGQEHCIPRERLISVIYQGRPKQKREVVKHSREALRDVHPHLLESEGK